MFYHTVYPKDYEAISTPILQFSIGDIRVIHTIDVICETNQSYLPNILLHSGIQSITPSSAKIVINTMTLLKVQ